MEDTGDLMEVPEEERLDVDGTDDSDYALEGGDDSVLLQEVYDNPGEVIEEDLG